jgi:hypothetical protein
MYGGGIGEYKEYIAVAMQIASLGILFLLSVLICKYRCNVCVMRHELWWSSGECSDILCDVVCGVVYCDVWGGVVFGVGMGFLGVVYGVWIDEC